MSPSYVSDHNIEMPLNEVPVEHDNITDIYDYMRAHSNLMGNRILSQFPALHQFDHAVSPRIERLLREPFPAQTIALMGVVKRWQQARTAMVVAECGTGKTLIALGAAHVHAQRRGYTVLAMVPPHLSHPCSFSGKNFFVCAEPMEVSYCVQLIRSARQVQQKMKVKKDLSTRLEEMTLEFQGLEADLRNSRELDARSLQAFRQSLDDLRMTAWTVSELMTARTTEKDPEVVLGFLAAERIRRFSQMARQLSTEVDHKGFTWESSGIQSLSDSLNLLQARLSKLMADHLEHFTASANGRGNP
jgi:hypothetical protein